MKHKLKIVLAFIAIGLTSILAGIYSSGGKSQTRPENKSALPDNIPTINWAESKPLNGAEAALREKRGTKYAANFRIDDSRPTGSVLLELPPSHTPVRPAFPVGESDSVIIGTVKGSEAFLLSDGSDVYSEFYVQVESFLKNRSPVELRAGSTIAAEREGGRVRFLSGRELTRGIAGQGFPEIGKRYVLFLRWVEAGQDFKIVTGYGLSNGKAVPLDGEGAGEDFSIYSNYKLFRGNDEPFFDQSFEEINSGCLKWGIH